MKNAFEHAMTLELNKIQAYFNACVELMDDDIRERIASVAHENTSNLEFLETYCKLHKTKYAEEFICN